MQAGSRADTVIDRLEVWADAADPVVTRLRVERMLEAIDMCPRALGRRAILCVRSLRDPLPGVFSIDGRQARPPPVWEAAMQREVERVARAAAWPARDAVPATAESVVFSDEAELLACLGSDLVTGGAGTRWWWPLLIPGMTEPRRAVSAAWRRTPEHAPAALQLLAERRRAEAFVQALLPGDARRLGAAIEARFALQSATMTSGVSDAVSLRPLADNRRPAPSAEPLAPWRDWVAEAEMPGLAADERALLGVALALARAPTAARGADFSTRLAAWWAHCAQPLSATQAPVGTPTERPLVPPRARRESSTGDLLPAGGPLVTSLDEPAGAGSAPDEGAAPPLAQAGPGALTVAGAWSDTKAAPAPEAVTLVSTSAGSAPKSDGAPEAHAVSSAAPSATETPPSAAGEPTAIRWSSPSAEERRPLSWRPRTRAFGAATDTGLGGLFYLVNAALYLDLYGDPENLPLSPWDFVALVGRRLLDEAGLASSHPGNHGDPIWALLAGLAGRAPEDPPGAGFAPPTAWRLPPRWLRPFPPAAPYYTLTPEHLLVGHPENFPILALALPIDGFDADADPDALIAAALAPYTSLALALPAVDPQALPPPPAACSPLDLWLARTCRYLAARLRRALDVATDAEMTSLLLAHQARVHASDTHVDVVLSLDALPIAIRFAGLDRDPGWVAAAGRFVAFHFE